tara:strand:- start:80 stop:1489 length:1410 start_codon:yes stop_codon:yes gene_type:complete
MSISEEDQLKTHLWELGDLSYLLHEGQDSIRAKFHETTGRRFIVNCSRRYGKSYLACVLALEHALKHPSSQIRIAAPTAKMVRGIIEPHMRNILMDAPRTVKPKHLKNVGNWTFPNGSQIHVAGCDAGNAERHRGTEMHLGIIEEAGFVDDLDYVCQDIFLPQTITTDGRIVMLSTPPRTPAHPFTLYCANAEANGNYVHKTIYDAPHITDRQREEYCAESGGEHSTTWRREYMAEFVVDESRAIVPEFSDNEKNIVGTVDRPDHFEFYTAADLGFRDLTFVVFAYYHFPNDTMVIEDELVLERANSGIIASEIRKKETALYGEQEPSMRVVDADRIVLADLSSIHRMRLTPARRDDRDAAINALRLAITSKKLLIHPRCTALRAHLRHGVWNKARTSFARSGEFGHFDGVAAACYLLRHAMRGRNPFPVHAPGVTQEDHFVPKRAVNGEGGAEVVEIFKPRHRKTWRR